MQDTKKRNTTKNTDVKFIAAALGYTQTYVSLVLTGNRPHIGPKARKILAFAVEFRKNYKQLAQKYKTKKYVQPISQSDYEDWIISKH